MGVAEERDRPPQLPAWVPCPPPEPVLGAGLGQGTPRGQPAMPRGPWEAQALCYSGGWAWGVGTPAARPLSGTSVYTARGSRATLRQEPAWTEQKLRNWFIPGKTSPGERLSQRAACLK